MDIEHRLALRMEKPMVHGVRFMDVSSKGDKKRLE